MEDLRISKTSHLPIYYQLRMGLKRLINESQWGDKLPTEEALARQHGVSRMTVRQAMSELVREGLVYRQRGRGTFVAAPSETQRKVQSLDVIGLVLANLDVYSRVFMADAAESAFAQRGYSLLVRCSHGVEEEEARIIREMMTMGIRGIMLAPTSSSPEHVMEMMANKFPFVLIDRTIEGINCNCVVMDDYRFSFDLVSGLAKKGYRRVAHFTAALHFSSYKERMRGWREAMERHGLAVDDNDLYVGSTIEERTGILGMAWVKRQDPRPDAIFCANEVFAVGALRAVEEIEDPELRRVKLASFIEVDMPIIGAEIPYAVSSKKMHEMTWRAAELLLDAIDSPSAEPVRLVIGK